MLILSRKPGEAILIGGGVRVVVVACDGGGARLGIEAPPSVSIVREEAADRRMAGPTDVTPSAGNLPTE